MIPITDDNIWLLDISLILTAAGFFILGTIWQTTWLKFRKK